VGKKFVSVFKFLQKLYLGVFAKKDMESPTRLVIHTQAYLQVLTLVINQAEIQDMSKLSFVEFYIVPQLFTSKTSNITKYLLMNNR
jgi:hypothetical protein